MKIFANSILFYVTFSTTLTLMCVLIQILWLFMHLSIFSSCLSSRLHCISSCQLYTSFELLSLSWLSSLQPLDCTLFVVTEIYLFCVFVAGELPVIMSGTSCFDSFHFLLSRYVRLSCSSVSFQKMAHVKGNRLSTEGKHTYDGSREMGT